MKKITADILVVGAGPAGSTLARELAKKYSVVLVEKQNMEAADSRPKPCGGLIAPDAQACLFHAGLTVPEFVLTGPQIFGVRAIDLESGHERTFQRHYLNVYRGALDRWLFGLAVEKEQVTPFTGVRLSSFTAAHDGVQVTLSNGTLVYAKVLVGADGASSRVRTLLHQDMFRATHKSSATWGGATSGDSCSTSRFSFWKNLCTPRRYLAMQAWYEPDATPPEFGAFFHQGVTDYYSWSIPKDTRLVLGTAIPWPHGATKSIAKKRFRLLVTSLEQYGYFLGKPLFHESCALLCPSPVQRFPTGRGRVFLAGEAAGFISPSSAEGLSYAMRSAMSLTKSFMQAGLGPEAHQAYRRYLRGLQYDLRCKCLKSAAIYLPQLRRLILGSGLGSFSEKSLW